METWGIRKDSTETNAEIIPKVRVRPMRNLTMSFYDDKDGKLSSPHEKTYVKKRRGRSVSKDVNIPEDSDNFSPDEEGHQSSPKTESKELKSRKRKKKDSSNAPNPKLTNVGTPDSKANICEEIKTQPSEVHVESVIYKDSNQAKHVQTSKVLTPRNLFSRVGELPTSFVKLASKHEEMTTAVEKSRQAFAAYKLSTFFCFDLEFLKAYGDGLSKIELTMKNMSSAIEKVWGKQGIDTCIIRETKTPSPNSKGTNKDVHNDTENVEVIKVDKAELSSLTPPPSEIGNDEKPGYEGMAAEYRKRKECLSKEDTTSKRSTRRKRNNVGSPVPSTSTETNKEKDADFKKPKNDNKDDSDSDSSDSDTKEGEYEVRKVQDYVRKQGGSYYRVSWRGYDSDEDTLEPAEHLDGCDQVLAEFFYERLKKRQNVTQPDQLRTLMMPNDERVKDLLYTAFERTVFPLSKEMKEHGVKFVSSVKPPVFKTKDEVQEDILKFLTLKDPSNDRYKKAYMSIVEQIGFKEIFQERQKQLADLRAWERSMNIISSDPAPLSVENNVDLELPPLDFIYINEYLAGPNVIIPSDPMAGCECKECNPLQKGCCATQMASYFAYNKYGRLRVSLGTPIYECNKACSCSADCANRVVQKGRNVALAIFRTSNGRGWGVKAMEAIRKDQFVSEYVGEVISSDEAEQRGMKYDTKGCTYLFDLDYNNGDLNPYTVDAVKYGNVSHFINHSCDPNLVVYNVWVNCLDPDLPKLALFAARDIRKGEEISFDYNSGSTRQISIIDKIDGGEDPFPTTPTKMLDDEGSTIIPTTEFIRKTPRNRVLNAGKTECRCGAANCRKFFF